MKHPSKGSKVEDYKDTVAQLKNYFTLFFEDEQEILNANTEFDAFSVEFSEVDDKFTCNPRVYWAQSGKRNYPALAKICLKLFQMICGSISVERVWNIFKFVHSKTRNKMSSERIEKLVFIYINSKLLDENDNNDYCDYDSFFGLLDD